MDRRDEIILNSLQGEYESIHDVMYGMEAVKMGMDLYATEMCLSLLQYIANNKIEVVIEKDEVQCYQNNGEGISKEQLFENFL